MNTALPGKEESWVQVLTSRVCLCVLCAKLHGESWEQARLPSLAVRVLGCKRGKVEILSLLLGFLVHFILKSVYNLLV